MESSEIEKNDITWLHINLSEKMQNWNPLKHAMIVWLCMTHYSLKVFAAWSLFCKGIIVKNGHNKHSEIFLESKLFWDLFFGSLCYYFIIFFDHHTFFIRVSYPVRVPVVWPCELALILQYKMSLLELTCSKIFVHVFQEIVTLREENDVTGLHALVFQESQSKAIC